MALFRTSHIAKVWATDCKLSPSTMGERLRAEARRLGRKPPLSLSYHEAINALDGYEWQQFPPRRLDGHSTPKKPWRDDLHCVKCGGYLDGHSQYLCAVCYKFEVTDFYNE